MLPPFVWNARHFSGFGILALTRAILSALLFGECCGFESGAIVFGGGTLIPQCWPQHHERKQSASALLRMVFFRRCARNSQTQHAQPTIECALLAPFEHRLYSNGFGCWRAHSAPAQSSAAFRAKGYYIVNHCGTSRVRFFPPACLCASRVIVEQCVGNKLNKKLMETWEHRKKQLTKAARAHHADERSTREHQSLRWLMNHWASELAAEFSIYAPHPVDIQCMVCVFERPKLTDPFIRHERMQT